MNFHENFSRQKFLVDFVTFNNFIGFVVAREYLDNITELAYSDERKVYNFYKFLLKLLQSNRIEMLRKIDYVVEYVNRARIKKAFSRDVEEFDDLKSATFHQNSLVGQFLRKFAVSFHLQPFDKVTEFCNSFYAYYDSSFSSNQVITFSEETINKAGRLGSLSSAEFGSLIEKLQSYQRNYPDLATPRFASHVVAMRQRNLSQAETNLFKAFEMAISWPPMGDSSGVAPEPRPVDAWTRMTLEAADMHHRFGHRLLPYMRSFCSVQARSFLHQALAQALETNDVLSLRHTKVNHFIVSSLFGQAAHEVITPLGEPFRYETVEQTDGLVPSDLLLAELCCKLFKLIGTGTVPQKVLLTYFNSVVAPQSDSLAIVLLNLAFIFFVYGYSILGTTLLQCVIIVDCLCPCSISDSVLSTSISQIARSLAAAGLPAQAVQIIKSAIGTIGRFEEFAHFERARVETQLEQALRTDTDLSKCSRLINDLALFCPWEANLRRANLEMRRGNQALATDILQALADGAESLRTATGVGDDYAQYKEANDENMGRSFKLLEPPRAGGIAALVRFEIRARIAMAEIFASNGVFSEALNQLECAALLSRQYHMKTFANICNIMMATISSFEGVHRQISLGDGTSIFEIFTDICHQAEPAVVMHLTNMKLWLSLLADYLNVEVTWKNQLCESATFFANIGDKYSLQKLVDIFVRFYLYLDWSNHSDCANQLFLTL
ncbi:unnamed protein product [Hydatigera taeniaeformis]|uniref:Spatacsin C-terminal domain-containing protein n=1 Tax=Hydatigena taeniaeformis TaxID=6205 RepID=A0A0R3WHY6_HYDTA|nr:unnamed protein product [Hydatigera taeniaeformis]